MADVRDPALRAESTAFMLGGDLLVVPRWAEHPALPRGMWASLSLVAGDESDADQPDLRLRAGAILPVGPLVQHTGDAARGPLTLFVHLNADGEATGQLYDDPGDGPADGSGPYRLTIFRAHRSASGAVVVERVAVEGEWVPPARDVIIYEVGAG
jgi:alpha-glucosidase